MLIIYKFIIYNTGSTGETSTVTGSTTPAANLTGKYFKNIQLYLYFSFI